MCFGTVMGPFIRHTANVSVNEIRGVGNTHRSQLLGIIYVIPRTLQSPRTSEFVSEQNTGSPVLLSNN